ncbi:hypothetical protein ELI_01745 [Erythrobacter litoralis HTCC2594]|uniref:Uncharacterized protein n=1 Tax=Erythrobacter litoralis (strain HTCC2594) TaxID=314225 RepID=Q2ND00_ERYLH|nr:hypothetical protein ELI_01745 [Erythrobacter litoralis HTCC2594]
MTREIADRCGENAAILGDSAGLLAFLHRIAGLEGRQKTK